jgi:tRNA1(Val) A37 N6-methylase TrmN6
MDRKCQELQVRVAGSLEQALALAAADSQRHVVVFERSWKAVDRARQQAERAGVAMRLSVHHDSARNVICGYWNAA